MFEDKIKIKDRTIGSLSEPFIIAEMACAHNGEIDQAKKLIDSAIDAKADAIQLQFFVADQTVTPKHQAYETIKEIEFSKENWFEIINYVRSKSSIFIFACTYDIPSVQLAVEANCDGIKLNCSDLSNPEVLKQVAKSKIPFTLGTGASTVKEIQNGINYLNENGASKMILMHGVQNFPTAIDDLNINRLELLQNKFKNIPIGYADHTCGDDQLAVYIDLVALGRGACVFEKHITLDRSKKGIDFQAALEPKEFMVYCKILRQAWKSLGSNEEVPFSSSDLNYRKFQKKSIVANRDIEIGEIISKNNLSFIRSENPGIAPIDIIQVLGKKTIKKINKYENILTKNLSH